MLLKFLRVSPLGPGAQCFINHHLAGTSSSGVDDQMNGGHSGSAGCSLTIDDQESEALPLTCYCSSPSSTSGMRGWQCQQAEASFYAVPKSTAGANQLHDLFSMISQLTNDTWESLVRRGGARRFKRASAPSVLLSITNQARLRQYALIIDLVQSLCSASRTACLWCALAPPARLSPSESPPSRGVPQPLGPSPPGSPAGTGVVQRPTGAAWE